MHAVEAIPPLPAAAQVAVDIAADAIGCPRRHVDKQSTIR
jgi:hypothetical protein